MPDGHWKNLMCSWTLFLSIEESAQMNGLILHNKRHCLPKAECLSNLWNDVLDKDNVALGKR